MARIKMIYFAQARDAVGEKSEDVVLPGNPRVGEALSQALARHPKLKSLQKAVKIAVNEEITSEDSLLRDGDRVALIPPVVGG